MNVKELVRPFIPNFILAIRQASQRKGAQTISQFEFDTSLDVWKDIQDKYGYAGDLAEFFSANKGYVVHKWHHYIPLYDRYFSAFRGRPIKFLEIGVSKGGSLQMWRNYFGENAVIFGIDIDPECEKYNGIAAQVRIGSQADKSFLERVMKEMGGVDIVLDDGSHHMRHISASLAVLFPHLSNDGLYMIEDLHTAYWKKWGGGYRAKRNFFGVVMDLIDDMHHWYHDHGVRRPSVGDLCSGIHVHDSIVVLEKSRIFRPVHSRIG